MLLARLLEKLIHSGSLTLIDAAGRKFEMGDGTDPKVTVRIHGRLTQWKLALNPSLYAGEAFMDGTLTIEQGTVYDFIDLATRSMWQPGNESIFTTLLALRSLGRLLQQINPAGRAKNNVAHHYDLSDKLYDLFLDTDRQYSCAYFERPDMTLEEAQEAKKRHIAAKLMLNRPDLTVLDIGCGWGGMALYLAAQTGAQVTGITLSEEQLKVARARAEQAGLADRVQFHLRDYRDEDGTFDRIVSVGMFEHVGLPHYAAFFSKMSDLLADDGVALLHSIGRSDGAGATNPWVRKYIFPGGYSPALSEVLPVVEKQLLYVTDIEILRLHYAKTLREWRRRFLANRDKVKALYDERFCRMWEFYLSGAETAFRNEYQMVFQLQITKDQEAVPLTRDYITEWEHARRAKSQAAE
jgi:cyclopropane-fatty-acyl-phospholipid synthase